MTSFRGAVFLDRDGTLIADTGYPSDPTAVRLLPGVPEALLTLAKRGWLCIVVTNQSAIGRGWITVDDFRATQRAMESALGAHGASIEATYHCPHAPDAGCLCRKPETALYREAAAVFNIDCAASWWIGDHDRDVRPALEFGGRGVLLASPRDATSDFPIAADLFAATALVPRYLSRP